MKKILALAVLSVSVATSASAAVVGVAGNDPYSAFLNSNGHSSSSVSLTASALAGLDTLILNRVVGNQAVVDFVLDGGLLITESSASSWALNTANMLDATDNGSSFVGTGTTISFTAAGLASNLDDISGPSFFTRGGAVQNFQNFSDIGASVSVLATRPGNQAAILAGKFGAGTVLIKGYDWNDQFYGSAIDSGNEQVLLESVAFDPGTPLTPVPLPATLPLVLAALGGFGLLSRFRKAS